LIERFQELAIESPHWEETENIWNYALGCLLGELSGSLSLLKHYRNGKHGKRNAVGEKRSVCRKPESYRGV
jgi:hypothetical protein